ARPLERGPKDWPVPLRALPTIARSFPGFPNPARTAKGRSLHGRRPAIAAEPGSEPKKQGPLFRSSIHGRRAIPARFSVFGFQFSVSVISLVRKPKTKNYRNDCNLQSNGLPSPRRYDIGAGAGDQGRQRGHRNFHIEEVDRAVGKDGVGPGGMKT